MKRRIGSALVVLSLAVPVAVVRGDAAPGGPTVEITFQDGGTTVSRYRLPIPVDDGSTEVDLGCVHARVWLGKGGDNRTFLRYDVERFRDTAARAPSGPAPSGRELILIGAVPLGDTPSPVVIGAEEAKGEIASEVDLSISGTGARAAH